IPPCLFTRARMGHGAIAGRPHSLNKLPQCPRPEILGARLPVLLALLEFLGAQTHIERSLDGVHLDDVAVADERDRTADRRLRPDMADAEAARCARKAPVGDESDLVAH